MKISAIPTFLVLCIAALGQTTINGGRTITGSWDASQATSTQPAKKGTALPSACTQGEQFFKTDATPGQNLYLCTATNTWTQTSLDFNPADPSVYWQADDFDLGSRWSCTANSGAPQCNAIDPTSADHPGVLRAATDTTQDHDAALRPNPSSSDSHMSFKGLGGAGTWKAEFIVKFANITNINFLVGFNSGIGMPASGWDVAAFVYEPNQNSGKFRLITCDSGTGLCTAVNHPAAPDTSNWFRFDIRSTSPGTILFSINGGAEIPVATNAPSGIIAPQFYVKKTDTGASAMAIDVDYYGIKWRGLSR